MFVLNVKHINSMSVVEEGNIVIFGKDLIEEDAIRQLRNCIKSPQDRGVLTADAHYGYGHPIGGAVAYQDQISLSGVGFDIACGNKAVKTDLKVKDVPIGRIMDEITTQIGFGIGRPNPTPVDHPVLEKIRTADFKPQRSLHKLAAEQLGTVGSGNHFIDLFEDEEGTLWIGVHFGSRGFGYKTTCGFIALSKGRSFKEKVPEGPMDSDPIIFPIDSALGQDYWQAIQLAGEYASAGRDLVVDKVLDILGAKCIFTVHNHHNFAWKENHFGQTYFVVRKGCTPAFPGQFGFVGSNMGSYSYIIKGLDTPLAKKSLYSTVHGAGRVISRTKAAGKRKWKRGKSVQVSKGIINFRTVQDKLKLMGIELRGGAADEAPECYKNLHDVLACHQDTIAIVQKLRPVGVAMAGQDVFDPYKD